MNPLDRIELTARRALDNRARARAALAWYDDAFAWCDSLAHRFGLAQTNVAGFVAALSPQNGWADQLRWIPEQIEAALPLLKLAPPGIVAESIPGPGFRGNKSKGASILAGADPLAVLRGPKVRAFCRNLSGDKRAVTVDRHAFAIAFGADFVGHLTDKRYRDCAAAYSATAAFFGVEPADLQALCWVYFKDQKEGNPW